MKTYFAKYIPVEGEIKEGDKYIIGKGLGFAYKTGYIGTAAINFTKEAQQGQEAKKLKLFLCSRDIQVGDKIENGITSIDKVSVLIKKDLPFMANNGWYKIIGEISPDAIWVKEGDKFNDEELMWKSKITGTTWSLSKKPKGKILEIGIKCSQCNTFH